MNNWIAPQFLGGRSRYGQNRGIFNGPNNANIDSYRLGGYGGLSGLPLGGVNPLALRTPGIGALARRGLGRGLFAGAGQNLGLQLAPPALQAAQLAQLGASGVRGGLGYASGLNSLNSLAPLGYGAVGQSLMGRSSCGGLCTEDIRGAHVCQICAARGDALGVLAATEDAGCSCPYCYTNQLYSAYAADPMSLGYGGGALPLMGGPAIGNFGAGALMSPQLALQGLAPQIPIVIGGYGGLPP